MPPVTNNSRWVLKRGKHAGALIQVVRHTDISIFFTDLGSGNAQGNQKIDQSQIHTVSRELFLARYMPEDEARWSSANVGHAYRRKYQPTMQVAEPQPVLIEPSATPLAISIETITPIMAQEWLDKGGKNRKLNERSVSRFVQAMQRGEWKMTGEGIKLDASGVIRDGQNRLTAIVRSGCTIQSLVVRNVSEDAFDVMDTGRSRSPADVLAIHGYYSTTALASITRNLINFERFQTIDPSGINDRAYVTAPLIKKYLELYPDVVQAMHLADNIRKAGLQGGTGLWGFLCALWWRVDQAHAVDFAVKLEKGIELEANHPALVLRNRALNRGMKWAQDGQSREELAIMAFKAWNAYCDGRPLTQLRVRDEEAYPKLKEPK